MKRLEFRESRYGRIRKNHNISVFPALKGTVARLMVGCSAAALLGAFLVLKAPEITGFVKTAFPAVEQVETKESLTPVINRALKGDAVTRSATADPVTDPVTVPVVVPDETPARKLTDRFLPIAGETGLPATKTRRDEPIKVKLQYFGRDGKPIQEGDPRITPPEIRILPAEKKALPKPRAELKGAVVQPEVLPVATTFAEGYTAAAHGGIRSAPLLTELPALKTEGGRLVSHRLGAIEIPGVWATYITTAKQEEIYSEIEYAALRTGVNPAYLQLLSRAESGHRVIGADTSSAAGPFQFIDSTWLQMMKTFGEKHGYKEFADHITKSGDVYQVADREAYAKIMALRDNPRASALMAAEYTILNHAAIRANFPKLAITPGHLYAGHFFGEGDVVRFINLLQQKNSAKIDAAGYFPKPAKSNYTLFYRGGQKLKVTQVYSLFQNKIAGEIKINGALIGEPRLDHNVLTVKLSDVTAAAVASHTLSARARLRTKTQDCATGEDAAAASCVKPFTASTNIFQLLFGGAQPAEQPQVKPRTKRTFPGPRAS